MAVLYDRMARFVRHFAADATYRLTSELVARRNGVPVDALRLRCKRRRDMANLKRQAIYLAVMAGHSRREIARVTGLSQELVARYCRAIEEARDDPALDRVLDELELEMTA